MQILRGGTSQTLGACLLSSDTAGTHEHQETLLTLLGLPILLHHPLGNPVQVTSPLYCLSLPASAKWG